MVALFIVSTEEAAGKTAIAAGISKRLLGEGKKLSFLKPAFPSQEGDAAFMKQLLRLAESADELSPSVEGTKEVADRVGAGKDVVIVEGRCGQSPQSGMSRDAYQLVAALKAKVLVVEAYSAELDTMKLAATYKGFGQNLVGIVFSKVPKSQMEKVEKQISPLFSDAGMPVLGEIPEDRALLTITIGEVAAAIQGEILNNGEKSPELVENIMLGAMSVDSGLEYFGRKGNKAVIVKNDRPDLQLAALETPTRCLVISGNGSQPILSVRDHAESKKIPIILTKSDVNTVVTRIEETIARSRFNQESKLRKLAEILEANFDFKTLYKALGF